MKSPVTGMPGVAAMWDLHRLNSPGLPVIGGVSLFVPIALLISGGVSHHLMVISFTG
jgi:hypothetical protein